MIAKVELAERSDLQTIAALHDAFCQAFAQPGPIEIDATRFAEGDVAAVQLIAAARAEAAACDRPISLTAPANPALAALLERCGLPTSAPADAAFWFHGDPHP